MLIAGYIAAALIGLSLGLIGGGGSILTVPVLVYLFGISPLMATSYSLFIVGSSSLLGAANNIRKKQVSFPTVLLFGLSSVLTVYLTRKFILPALPEEMFRIRGFVVTESFLTMILFALLMVLASFSMIRNQHPAREQSPNRELFLPALILYGIGIGLVTGLLGAGGGFLLIPVLVFAVGLPMKTAIGTSLLIIAMNSLVGFTGDLGNLHTDWKLLMLISGIAMVGILAGGALSGKIPGGKLKKGFGWFVLAVGIYIIIREIFGK